MQVYSREVVGMAAVLAVCGVAFLVKSRREKSRDMYRAAMSLLLVAVAFAVGGLASWVLSGWSR